MSARYIAPLFLLMCLPLPALGQLTRTVQPDGFTVQFGAKESTDFVAALARAGDGSLYVGGQTERGVLGMPHPRTSGSKGYSCPEGYLARFDAAGAAKWVTPMGFPGCNGVFAVIAADDGGAFVAGTYGAPEVRTFANFLFVARYRPDGQRVWLTR